MNDEITVYGLEGNGEDLTQDSIDYLSITFAMKNGASKTSCKNLIWHSDNLRFGIMEK